MIGKFHAVFASFISVLLCMCTLNSCSGSAVSSIAPSAAPSLAASPQMSGVSGNLLIVSYMDIGQGDCILVQAPGGKTMLIDAGNTDKAQIVADCLLEKGIETIDVLIATHPKQSHIGGMPYIVQNFEIGSFYMPDTALTNAAESLKQLKKAVSDKGIAPVTATAGLSIDLGDELIVDMIAPVRTDYTSSNDFSAVVRIVYGQTSFLFTGDATEISERDILRANTDVMANVLKIGHHGEATSSCMEFLQAVQPEYAIISVGADNWYGHPEQATIDRLRQLGIKCYRTDQDGTVVVMSDGQNIQVFTENGS